MLSNIKNELDISKIYIPSYISSPSSHLLAVANINKRRNLALADAYKAVDTAFEEYKLRTRSNNWLKMHGYPMRKRHRK